MGESPQGFQVERWETGTAVWGWVPRAGPTPCLSNQAGYGQRVRINVREKSFYERGVVGGKRKERNGGAKASLSRLRSFLTPPRLTTFLLFRGGPRTLQVECLSRRFVLEGRKNTSQQLRSYGTF